MHAGGRQFPGKHVRESLDGSLAHLVRAEVRTAEQAADRANVDDAAVPLASHVRHDGARHPDDPKEIRLEDRPGLFHRAFFRGGWSDAEAGVVNEQFDRDAAA